MSLCLGAGIYDLNTLKEACESHYNQDQNILVASWFDNLGYTEREHDDKVLFYNSESILAKENVLDHFSRENKQLFQDKNFEFVCKKGKLNNENQDNFFCLSDGVNKIIGLFDGHGRNGN